MNAKLQPVLRLFGLIRSVHAFGREHAAALDLYEESVFSAIAHLLSAFAHLCNEATFSGDDKADTPYYDFGPEPLTRDEARSALSAFLDEIERLLKERITVDELPLAMMEARARTFACELSEGDVPT